MQLPCAHILTSTLNNSLILAIASSTFLINYLHFVLTVKYRKASGIKYPNAYASQEQADKDKNAYMFNCGTLL